MQRAKNSNTLAFLTGWDMIYQSTILAATGLGQGAYLTKKAVGQVGQS
jgi:hypothetical protein